VRAVTILQDALGAQRASHFLWVPVFFGTGIGIYFGLRSEPALPLIGSSAVLAGALVLLGRRLPEFISPVVMAIALILAGLTMASLRAHAVGAPVLDSRTYGPVQGRITTIDRSGSDLLRLTLDQVVLADTAPQDTPAQVRVSLQGDQSHIALAPGQTVALTAMLSPPNGPVEPGDFDFRRMFWFERIGAMGYTGTPVMLIADPQGVWLSQTRAHLADGVRSRIAGDAGGFAAAVMTGDRSGLSAEATQAMRDSNLYHLVSISGMHMGMLVGVVFALIRVGVALVPPLALRVPAKKVAAMVALPIAAFYLALAGRDVATERAFVMVAVMLVAILLDRQALTLRSVAMAALIVLILRPESLVNPGFQMSFAAVVALIAAYQALAGRADLTRWRWVAPAAFLVFSSLIAGLATAPFAAAHFNRVAHYGLIANLLAVPAMGLLVMPGAVLMAVLAPLGLARPAEIMVDLGSRWVLTISRIVADWDGAVSAVISPPATVLPLLTLGALFLILWQGRLRWAGLLLPAVAGALWFTAERPVLMIAGTGGLVGVMTDQGRAVSRASGEGFIAENWLENDGEVVDQATSFARLDGAIAPRTWTATVGGQWIIHVTGETALTAMTGCGGADILVTNEPVPSPRPCQVLDPATLAATGAMAASVVNGQLHWISVAEDTGHRLWTKDPAPVPALPPADPSPEVLQARISPP
jgi:competence protein ComEC